MISDTTIDIALQALKKAQLGTRGPIPRQAMRKSLEAIASVPEPVDVEKLVKGLCDAQSVLLTTADQMATPAVATIENAIAALVLLASERSTMLGLLTAVDQGLSAHGYLGKGSPLHESIRDEIAKAEDKR